jgi:hypothetical protein
MGRTTKRKEQSEKLRNVKSSYQSSTPKSGFLFFLNSRSDLIIHLDFVLSDFFFNHFAIVALQELARSLPSGSGSEDIGAGWRPVTGT